MDEEVPGVGWEDASNWILNKIIGTGGVLGLFCERREQESEARFHIIEGVMLIKP